MLTTNVSWTGEPTLEYGAKTGCSLGKWVKAKDLLEIQDLLFTATEDFPHGFNVIKNSYLLPFHRWFS